MAKNKFNFNPGKNKQTKAQKRAQKKAIKKEKKMMNKIGFNGFGGFGKKSTVTKPTDGVDNKTLNIVLFKQSFLNALADQCVPVAGGAEFQVHYRALQIIIEKENIGRIVYTFPTVFFNFNQTVTTGSVDYNLVEVDKISKDLQPESMKLAGEIAKLFPKAFFENNGFTVNFREDEIGSIHRHPGDFSFSSIDLDNNPSHPGVIYRRGNAKDLIQTDSVMYITGAAGAQHVKLVTTQTRVVDVNLLGAESGIEGTYKRAKTVAMILKNTDTTEEIIEQVKIDFNAFFNDDEVREIHTPGIVAMKENFLPRYDKIKEDEIQEVLENTSKIFKIISSKVDVISKVDEKLIKANTFQSYGGSYGRGYNNNQRFDHTTGTWLDDGEDELAPLKFNIVDVLKYRKLNTPTTKVTEILDDINIRILFWMCGGKNELVTFSLNSKPVSIEPVSKYSLLLKVVYNGTTTYKSKGIFENNDISDELIEAGFKDEEDSSILPAPDTLEALKTPDTITDAQSLLKIQNLFAKNELVMPEVLMKDIDGQTQCEEIFKKVYPGTDYDNNGLLKIYNDDGFKEILMMIPEDSGIVFVPKTETESFVYIAPIEASDTHGTVKFCNNAVKFSKQVPLYQEN